jgi:hypothetical protein
MMTAIAAIKDEQRPLASGGCRRQLCGSGDGSVAAVDGSGNDGVFTK